MLQNISVHSTKKICYYTIISKYVPDPNRDIADISIVLDTQWLRKIIKESHVAICAD